MRKYVCQTNCTILDFQLHISVIFPLAKNVTAIRVTSLASTAHALYIQFCISEMKDLENVCNN